MLAEPRLRLPRGGISILKGSELVVAGYASVELVDKQGDLITKEALKDAFGKFMENPGFQNVQLAHSNIQVGEVVSKHTDSNGRVWKSEVDDVGMFVVVKLRSDIEKAREVAAEIRKGNLRGFSIGGQAFKRMNKSDKEHGDYTEISKLELHEVTICEKGINPEAQFRILKEDTTMTSESSNMDTLDQLSSVLNRLETRIDSMEKGEMPPFMEDKKESKDSDEKKDEKKDEKEDDDMEKSQYSDVITSEYLDWLESTVKSAGVDTAAARNHFDQMNKANLGSTPEQLAGNETQRTGQAKGHTQVEGKPEVPKANYGTGGKGKASTMNKSEFLHPDSVNPADVEAAYQVYKAAALEQQFKESLGDVFETRLSQEQAVEKAEAEKHAYDARGPMTEVMKAIEQLNERIDTLSGGQTGTTLQKSAPASSSVAIPTTEELANMDWNEVHNLAGTVWHQGE